MVQGGEDAQDAFSCRCLSAKKPLIIWLFCGKYSMKIRHSMHLHHPVWIFCAGDMTIAYSCRIWLLHTCDMTHPCVSPSIIRVPWLHNVGCGSGATTVAVVLVCVPWLILMCAMTHSYVCHDSMMQAVAVARLQLPWYSYLCHDSFICVSWLIHMCAVTHSYVSVTHSYVCHD